MGLIMKNGISYGGGSEGGSGNANIVKLTQAEYDALPSSKNSDGILYAITDGEGSSGGTSKPVELTKAQYEALGESTKTDGILYAITDGDELSAKNLEYDGSVTGLGNNVQDAIDGLNSNIDKQNKKLTNITGNKYVHDVCVSKTIDVDYTSATDIYLYIENHEANTYYNVFIGGYNMGQIYGKGYYERHCFYIPKGVTYKITGTIDLAIANAIELQGN